MPLKWILFVDILEFELLEGYMLKASQVEDYDSTSHVEQPIFKLHEYASLTRSGVGK